MAKIERLRNGCCGCSLRTTGLTVSILGIVASTLLLMYCVFALGNLQKFCKQIFFGSTFSKETCDDCQFTSAVIRASLMFFGGIFGLAIHTALEVGISKNKPFLVFLYIVTDVITAIIFTIGGIVLLAMGSLPLAVTLVALIAGNALNVYLVWIFYSLKLKLEQGIIDQV